MDEITLPGSDVVVSRISLGTGALHHLPTPASRQRLLLAALDAGVTHFDTSPYYGDGLAEKALGRLSRSRPRGSFTLATKVGLYGSSRGGSWVGGAWLRAAVARTLPGRGGPRADWSLTAVKRGFEESLRRCATDYVDFLFLHEPPTWLDAAAFYSWFVDLRDQGRIREWGVAGDPAFVEPWVRDADPLAAVVQTRDSIGGREADFLLRAGRPLQFTYGYLSAAAAAERGPDMHEAALSRNQTGSIVVSTRRQGRLDDIRKVVADG